MPTAVTLVRKTPRLPPRARASHKGDYGRVLVVGGSRGMIGAPALAANAALRSGCGLAVVAVPDAIQLAVATLAPCATSLPLPATRRGLIAGRAVKQLAGALRRADVLALGPGLEASADGVRLVRHLLTSFRGPIVLDADGLNNACRASRSLCSRAGPLVLTPHPGEATRLLKALQIRVDPIVDRGTAAWRLAQRTRSVVVLKGHRTIVTDGRRLYVNTTGNPGMATGGTGDVLTGVTAALIAQSLDPFDAAVLAVFVHGRAGDLAARRLGEGSLVATDVIDALPEAFRSIR